MNSTNQHDTPNHSQDLIHPQSMARLIWNLDCRRFATLVPHATPEQRRELRQDWATWTTGSRHGWTNWQEAWNEFITNRGDGRAIYLNNLRCEDCNARGFNMRRGTICPTCHGRRRVSQTLIAVLAAAE